MLERIGQALSRLTSARASTEPIDFSPMPGSFFAQGIGNQPSHEDLLRENMGVFDMATRAIANRVSSLDPLVKVSRRTSDGTLEDETLDDHPLKMLLDRPHPNFAMSQLLRLTAQYIVTVGEAYWLKVGSGLGVPVELHPMPPQRVTPRFADGYTQGYRVETGSGSYRDLPADTVIRFYFPDPEDPWNSEGYLGPSGRVVDANKFAEQHLRSHYQNDATPKTALEAGLDAEDWSPASWRNYAEGWTTKYHNRLGTQMGAPAKIPTGWTLKELKAQYGQDLVPLLEFWERSELKACGTPRSILGEVVSGDRSAAETQQFVFDQHTIQPIAHLISTGLTLQLAPDFDPKIFVEFDGFISEDKTFRLEQEKSDLTNKVRSPKQVLRDRGSDPEDASWGEFPVGQIGQIPYTGDDGFEFEMDDESALGVDSSPPPPSQTGKGFDEGDAITGSSVLNGAQVASIVTLVQEVALGTMQKASAVELMGVAFGIDAQTAAKIIGDPVVKANDADSADRVRTLADQHARKTYFDPDLMWQRQAARERKYVPLFLRAVREILKKQRDTTLARLRTLEEPRARQVNPEDIFNPAEWVALFERTTEPLREAIFLEVLKGTLPALGVTAPPGVDFQDFVFTDAMREVIQKQGATMIRQVNATTGRRIAKALEPVDAAIVSGEIEAGAVGGESIDAIAKRVQKVFSVRRHEAATIARTEVLTAASQAQLESYRQGGVTKKTWLTNKDPAVRDSHLIDGQTVGIDETFTLVDGERADAPGVGAGGSLMSAGNRINCRCEPLPG